MSPRLRARCTTIVLLSAIAVALAAQAPEALEPGRTVSGTITAGVVRTFRVDAAPGDFLRLVADQDRIDLDVRIVQPDGAVASSAENAVVEEDQQTVSTIASAGGAYRVELKLGARPPTSGHFRLTLSARRPAGAGDEQRVAADRAYSDAVVLRARATAEAMRSARNQLEAAIASWHGAGDREGEARAFLQLSEVVFRLGDVRGALEASRQSLAIFRELGDGRRTASALNNVAVCLNTLGDPTGALENYEEALPLIRTAGDRTSEGNLLNNIGRAYSVLSDHQKALGYLEQALPIRVETGDRLGEAITLNNLGLERSALGDFERARTYHERALRLYREVGDIRGTATALNNLGLAYQAMHDFARARDQLQNALAVDRTAGDERLAATHLHNLAAVYADERKWRDARDYFAQALVLRRKTGDRFGESVTLGRLGATYVETGEPALAVEPLNEALRIADELGDGQSRALAQYHLARIDRESGRRLEAIERLETILRWFESVRSQVPGPDLRASYFATVRFAYELLIDTLLDLHRADSRAGFDVRAFEASERARARSMLDQLTESSVDIHQGVDAASAASERRLRAQLATQVDRRIRAAAAGAQRPDLARQDAAIDSLTVQLEAVRADLRAGSPQFAALMQPRALSLQELRSEVLDPRSVLFEYFLGSAHSALWIVTRTALVAVDLPARDRIESLARRAYEEVSSLGSKDTGAAAALARVLFPIDMTPYAARRLLIVSDGALQLVPFAALPMKSGAPLAASNDIVALPSASTLALLRRDAASRPRPSRVAAVLADPVFDRTDARVPVRTQRASTADQPDSLKDSSADAGIAVFDRLPSSREEAAAIAALAGPRRSLVALDFDASRETVLSGRLEPYRVVHFATHGLLDSQRPALSGLVLSLVDRDGRAVNGFLQVNDIYNLKLRADLVVLSACRTGLGTEVRGEGLIGMTRAFMYAGAPRVMASLWAVPNRATTELMKVFYTRYLIDGLTPSAALRSAQNTLRNNPRWSAPFYWAGFVVQGEPR